MTEAVIIQKPVHSGANQRTGFYIIMASVMKELSLILPVNLNANDVILINFSKLNMFFMSVLISEFDHSAKHVTLRFIIFEFFCA